MKCITVAVFTFGLVWFTVVNSQTAEIMSGIYYLGVRSGDLPEYVSRDKYLAVSESSSYLNRFEKY